MLLSEWRLDQNYLRFALLASAPFLFCVGLASISKPTFGGMSNW